MKIETPEPHIGALVTGVDVTKLDEADWQKLYRTWLDRSVLVVRDQELNIDQFLKYSSRFGAVKPHRVHKTRHPEHPELTVMGINTKLADGKVNTSVYKRGADWHTDGPWDDQICKATQLYGLAIPSYGGDTLFANAYLAYERLPEELKKRIDGLRVEFAYGGRARQGIDLLEPEDRERPPAVHSLVRVHPETGRKSLYINPVHYWRIVGMSQEDSDALAEELFSHVIQPDGQYRHQWKVGDIVIWDNRCSLHSATGGYPIEEKRIHWRVTIME
jgi:taurine dioxygenase